MLSTEHLGVTSIVRALCINPAHYECLIWFFRADSWTLDNIERTWMRIVADSGFVFRISGIPVLIGDGVKVSKEGRKMPGVKNLHQESGNSAKPDYIRGHMFGAIGALLNVGASFFCTPLSMRLHDGNEVIGKWSGDVLAEESHVVRMIREACAIAARIGESFLLLDRYFLTVPALKALTQAESDLGRPLLRLVTKAKKNAVAYEPPSAQTGRGRPRKKGAKIQLLSLFDSSPELFMRTKVKMYGKTEEIEYLVRDLLWGVGLYRQLRFVMVKRGGERTILVCTDTSIVPETIIELYALRFKIEVLFREFKQVVAGFAYRFWSSAMPRLDLFAKNADMRAKVEAIDSEKNRTLIVNTLKATERFVLLACIALGLLQLLTLRFDSQIKGSAFRWLRTKRAGLPSEATTSDFMRKTIFHGYYFPPDLGIARIIQSAQPFRPSDNDDSVACS